MADISEVPTKREFEELLAYIPILEKYVGVDNPERGPCPEVRDFFQMVLNRQCWYPRDENRGLIKKTDFALMKNDVMLRRVSLEDLCGLLVTFANAEFMGEGIWDDVAKEGRMLIVLRRLKTIYEQAYPPSTQKP